MSKQIFRRSRQKLRSLRRINLAIVQQPRLLAQTNNKWNQLKLSAIHLGIIRKSIIFQPNTEIGLYQPFRKTQQNYKKNHQAVQSLKLFYSSLKNKQLAKLIKNTGIAYRNRIRTSTKPNRQLQHQNLKTEGSLISNIESFLIVALWRSFLVNSMEASRQNIVHGHVKVNGIVIKRPSYKLKAGDRVQLVPTLGSIKSIGFELIVRKDTWKQLKFRCPPTHIEVNHDLFIFVFNQIPFSKEVSFPFNININQIRAFYKQ